MNPTYNDLLKDLERYIEENWTGTEEEHPVPETIADPDLADFYSMYELEVEEDLTKGGENRADGESSISLESLLLQVGDSFHEMLFQLIDESGMTDVEVYKRANLDRKLFSKIRSNPAYHPRKGTVVALAIALKLDVEQTVDLLARAEYALSPGSKSDVIIRYFIERKVFDIVMINIALHDHGLPILE